MPLYKKSPAFLFVMAGCALNLLACSAERAPQKSPLESGIVHGQELKADDEASRAVVALVAQLPTGQALCTGSIIDETTILTAAHCVDDEMSELKVVFSAHAFEAKPEMTRIADRFTQNPRWRRPTDKGKGDLALVHFTGGLPAGFHPVILASDTTPGVELHPGQRVLLVGYGVTNGASRAGAGVLRKTTTTVTGAASSTEVETDGHKASVCFGDSGGPGFTKSERELVQWGVASSVTSSDCNEFSIHTDVRPYANWIKTASQRLKKNSGEKRRPRTDSGKAPQPTRIEIDEP